MTGGCRLEQLRLVLQAEEFVVVGEIDVAIEREGPQVREIVKAVALQPGAELQLEGKAHGEHGGKNQRCPFPASPMDRISSVDQRRDDERDDEQERECSRRVLRKTADDGAARHFAGTQFENCRSRGDPRAAG